MLKSTVSAEAIAKGEELIRIANLAALAAQEENRRLGIPNVYSINGVLYWELPDGTLSHTDPLASKSTAHDDSNASPS
jgi:hypothetical protein